MVKNAILMFVAVVFIPPDVYAARGWLIDYDQALREAKIRNKYILADFTGSDWCGWCKRLKREVFDRKEFKKWANKNVILLELDYPRNKKQSAKIKSQNARLKDQYRIRGFPTIYILTPDGRPIGQLGYIAGGPHKWTAEADRILSGRPKPKQGQFDANVIDKAKQIFQGFFHQKEPEQTITPNVLPEDSMKIYLKSGVELVGALREGKDGLIEVDSGNIKVSIRRDQIERIESLSESQMEEEE